MMSNKIYEPIRRKIEEWIDYDVHSPKVPYRGNEEVHDEYRRWHDRDCVLSGGNLYADTMFSLWRPLKDTIIRLNDKNVIHGGKYKFIRELLKGDNMGRLLSVEQPIVKKLSTLFELGMGRENVFLLPDRELNVARGRKPYEDYVPVFLFESFGDGDILPENIKDLSGAGDVRKSLAPDGILPMKRMLDNYISILLERRKYFTAEELENAARMDEMMREGSRIQVFKDRIANGEPEALMQVKDVMDV